MSFPEGFLDRARAGAADRDRTGELPHGLVRELLDYGFGAVRVPKSAGGGGHSVVDTTTLLIGLAAADSNLAHIFRGHLAVVEQQLFEVDVSRRDEWYRRIVDGALIGNAQSELADGGDVSTTLQATAEGLRLNGRKYYTTGSIYADWIDLSARYLDEDYQVLVSTDHAGVTSRDDWAGFGQRLTGSGTTTFVDVPVDAVNVRPYAADADGFRHPYMMGFFQLVLLAVTAGIAQAVVDDAVAFVQPRQRIFGHPGSTRPAEHPIVQDIVGDLSSRAFAARAITLEAARSLDCALAGERDPAAFARAQLDVYRAQQVVLPLVVDSASRLFEVGGASAVDTARALDRHWRNARTVATHNPALMRRRAVGEWELAGVVPQWPDALWERVSGRGEPDL